MKTLQSRFVWLLSLVCIAGDVSAAVRGGGAGAGASSSSAAADALFDSHRSLQQTAACGATLGTVTADQVVAAGRLYIDSLLTPELQAQNVLNTTAGVLLQTSTGNFTVMKHCGSCEQVVRLFFEEKRLFPNYHFEYCGSDNYGWSSLHSALVLIPIDENGLFPDQVKLRTFMNLKESRLNLDSAPTESNMVETMATIDTVNPVTALPFLTDYLVGMMAASSGSIAIFPDMGGYGENAVDQNRTTFNAKQSQQAAVVSYLTVEYYLKFATSFCTLADRAITVYGQGDGGAVAPFVGDVFRRFGYQVLKVFSAGPILDLETFLMDAIAQYDAGSSSRRLNEIVLLALFTYSAGTPGLNNTGSTTLFSDSYREVLVQALAGPVPERYGAVRALLPVDVTDIINSEIVQLFRDANSVGGGTRPCSASLEQELCQEILESSGWRVLRNEVSRLIFPVEVCYSPDDALLSANQFPESIFTSASEGLVTSYAGPTGLPDLAPAGSHIESLRLCSLSPMLFFTLQGHRPVNPEDRGNFQPLLTVDESQFCLESARTTPPTSMPTSSPTDSPMANPGIQVTPSNPRPLGDSNPPPSPTPGVTSTAPTRAPSDSSGAKSVQLFLAIVVGVVASVVVAL